MPISPIPCGWEIRDWKSAQRHLATQEIPLVIGPIRHSWYDRWYACANGTFVAEMGAWDEKVSSLVEADQKNALCHRGYK